MKKSMLMIAVLAMSALAMVSCKKDKEENNGNGITTIFAKMDGSKTGGEKTHLGGTGEDGYTATLWSTGDKVGVFTGTGEPTEYTLTNGENTSNATFSGATLLGGAPYCAFYPYKKSFTATRSGDSYTVTFTLPRKQTYQAPKGDNPTFAEATAPMIAYSTDGSNYTFKNVMGTLKVDLTGTGKISKLVLTDNNSGAMLYGTATVSVSGEAHNEPVATFTGGGNKLTLDCNGVELDAVNATSFYFVVPVGTLGTNGFKIDVYDMAYQINSTIDRSYVSGNIIQRNVISSMKVEGLSLPASGTIEGVLSGVFSVSAEKKVSFSKGNLQYKASDNTWRFAENQWDYVGGTEGDEKEAGTVYENGIKCKNNLISSTYDGWIDLFGWGTSGYNHGATNYQPWSTSLQNTSELYYAYGNRDMNLADCDGTADWGYNKIENGGNVEDGGWFTLSKSEWDYIFNGRTNAANLYTFVTTGTMKGCLVIAPDGKPKPKSSYNTDTWATDEENYGYVCFPPTGARTATTPTQQDPGSINYYTLSDNGYYWLSSATGDSDSAWRTNFSSSGFFGSNSSAKGGRYQGFSVRLVRYVN